MESLLLYWVLTLVVIIILTLISDIGTATLITSFIVVGAYLAQEYNDAEKHLHTPSIISGFEDPQSLDSPSYMNDMTSEDNINPPNVPITPIIPLITPFVSSDLPSDVLAHNEDMLNDVLSPPNFSADDKILDASIVAGGKAKKSVDIRSHWNNNNWKKYYDYELGIHADTSRDWWQDDDEELARKHVVI